jgi:hypothetical protein
MSEMVINIFGNTDTAAYKVAVSVFNKLGMRIYQGSDEKIDLAIAPLLTFKLYPSELNKPRLGTLIFHPSSFCPMKEAQAL